tara:strand:- start:2009 stop:5332 length:3324 start_codon:yes stop_codon:yes gene_type:complete
MIDIKELDFIIDEPAEVDFLNTHTPVASAIAHSIITAPRLKVIGLLGRWGSGKSTIAKEIESQLNKAKATYLTFTYDAWLHQNNPLRRSFLESLVEFLKNQDGELLEDEIWGKKLKELSGELKITDEYETPIVTAEAKLFFILTFCLTIGLSFLGTDTFRDAWGDSTTRAGVWTFWLGAGLVVTPIIIWLLRALALKLRGKKVSWLPALIFNKKFEHVNRQTYNPIEPTSIEFGRTFRELMQTLKRKGVLLVVVIDNIDRIDESEALRIWASVRSFFLSSHDDNNLEFESYHPTVVLPIDAQSIAHMFAINSNGRNDETAQRLTRSFINKNFDVTFDVPAPVTSDWKRYLKDRMNHCLGKEYTEERYFRTRQYLESWFNISGTQITPRDINKTLNRIVALLIQRKGDDIPFETVVYFSIYKDSIYADIEKEVSKSEHPLSLNNKDWAREIAALYFGVDVELAAQVLMTEPIRKAIIKNNAEHLVPFHDVVGFADVFEQVTAELPEDENAPNPSFLIITNAALLLAQQKSEGLALKESWCNLIRAFNKLDGSTRAPNLAERISVFYDHLDTSDAALFIRTVEGIVDEIIAQEELNENAVSDLGQVGAQAIQFATKTRVKLPIFDFSGDAKSYLDRLHWMQEFPVTQSRFRTSAKQDALKAELVRRITSEAEANSVPELVGILTSSSAELMIGKKLENIDDLLAAAENSAQTQADNATLFGAAIKTIAAPEGFLDVRRAALDRLATDNTLSGKFGIAINAGDESTAAIILAVLIWKKIDIKSPIKNSWASLLNRHSSIPSITNQYLNELYEAELPINILEKCYGECLNSRDLVRAILNDRVKKGNLGTLNTYHILSNLTQYTVMIDISLRGQFVEQLADYPKFWPNIRSMPWNRGILQAALLLRKQDTENSDKITRELNQRVQKSTAKEWTAAVISGSEPFKIVTEFLNPTELKLGVNSNLASALIDCAAKVGAEGSAMRSRWFALSEVLTSIGRRKTMLAMSNVVFDLSPIDKISLLKSGGEKFLADARYHQRPDLVIDNLVLPLAKSKKGREWLNDRGAYFRPIMEKASNDNLGKITKLIREFRKSTDERKRHWSEIIEKEWRLKIK